VLREPDGTGPSPEQMLKDGTLLVGSVETVTRQLETLVKQTPVEWIFAWMYNGLIPHAVNMKSIELFKTKVLPRFE